MAKIVTVEIGGGQVDVDTAGYHGRGCDAVQAAFAKELGTTTKVIHKKEYAELPTVNRPITR